MRFTVSALAVAVLLPLSPGRAQQPAASPYPPAVQAGAPVASPILGRYTSPSLYPATLALTISGVDAAGNVAGAVSGMRNVGSPSGFQQRSSFRDYRAFTYVFGAPRQPNDNDNIVRATFNGSALAIQYGSGARLDLIYSNNEFSGSQTDPRNPERNKPVWFHRSQ